VVNRLGDLEGSDPLIVGDKAVLTAPNRAGLRGEREDWTAGCFDYVTPIKRTAPIKAVLKAVNTEDCQAVGVPVGASPLAVTEIDPAAYIDEDDVPGYVANEQIRWIVGYNRDKASDDAANRLETLAAVSETLEAIEENQYGDNPHDKADLLEKVDATIPNRMAELLN
jgi:hypothetical protein